MLPTSPQPVLSAPVHVETCLKESALLSLYVHSAYVVQFRYATGGDKALICLGVFSAFLHGGGLPGVILILGKVSWTVAAFHAQSSVSYLRSREAYPDESFIILLMCTLQTCLGMCTCVLWIYWDSSHWNFQTAKYYFYFTNIVTHQG